MKPRTAWETAIICGARLEPLSHRCSRADEMAVIPGRIVFPPLAAWGPYREGPMLQIGTVVNKPMEHVCLL